MNTTRRPKVGDVVRFGEKVGMVRTVLNAQFVFVTEAGEWVHCLFTEDWDYEHKGGN